MTLTKQTCPRCGGELRRVSGFRVCASCNHRMGSQSLETDWSRYEYGWMKPHRSSDEQTRPERRHNPKRRNPLAFD